MCSLFINDLDAGAGRMGAGTQYTVNNQMVNATLMNIADNPSNVQLPGVYKQETIPRVPIVCTGELRFVSVWHAQQGSMQHACAMYMLDLSGKLFQLTELPYASCGAHDASAKGAAQ